MLKSLRHTRQLLKIALTFARHDALFGLEALGCSPLLVWGTKKLAKKQPKTLRNGQKLANALESLGPSYIKLGQILSTRADLVGEEIARDLTYLRDQLPPFPTLTARKTIEAELDASLDSFFSEFDTTPVAAASIAQVHFATTTDGRDVAVKILRPGIEEQFKRDTQLMHWLAELVERRAPHLRRLQPKKVAQTLADSLLMELDLRFEAAAAEELRANFKEDSNFYIPEIDWQRSGGRVLTLERIEGVKIDDIDALNKAGHDVDHLVRSAAEGMFRSVFQDGFFHADPHPGNLFVMTDGRIGVVDFGIMGRLDEENQLWLAEVLWGMFKEDYDEVARIHFERGIVPSHFSQAAFAQACRAIGKPIMGKPVNEISIGKLLGQLLHVAQSFEMQLQPQLLLLQKTMMLTEGVGRALNPNINMWQTAEPMIQQWGMRHLGPRAKIKRTAEQGIEMFHKLPTVIRGVEKTLEDINEGGVKLHPDTVALLAERSKQNNKGWKFLTLGVLLTLALVATSGISS